MKENFLAQSKKILVIGAGVTGLTTAISLREAGFEVTIAADRFAPNLTSVVAGALWEWPPAVCGHHGAPRSLERSKEWCMTSYHKFKQMHADFGSESTGIYLRDVYFYFKDVLENQPADLNKMNELKDKVDGFERGMHVVKESINLGFQGGIKDVYKHMSPMIDTDIYMKWLLQYARNIGCEIVREKITFNVIENEQELLARFNVQAIVNCAGLGSIVTTGDPSMHPLRGALVRVKNLQGQGVIKDAHCISHDKSSNDEQDIIFIVPRGDGLVILGGLAQQDQWSTDLSLDVPIIAQMYDGCLQFLEELRKLPLDEIEPVRTGLRPSTEKNVCLERVPNTRVFYNYGHGGSGVTLSWGCSEEIVQLVIDALNENTNLSVLFNNKINNSKQTIFLLYDIYSPATDFSAFKSGETRNLILICTRAGLSKIVPNQYQYFDDVQIIESFDLEKLLEINKCITATYEIYHAKSQVITNDWNLMLLAAQFDEYLMLLGTTLRKGLKFIGEYSTIMRQFSSPDNFFKSSAIQEPKQYIFEPDKYYFVEDLYLQYILDELGSNILIETVSVNDDSDSRKNSPIVIRGLNELKKWCDNNINSSCHFKLNQLFIGQKYSVSIVIKDSQPCYFAISKDYRSDDKFLEGFPISSIIPRNEDPEFERIRQFSLTALKQLTYGYPPNGVLNINLLLEQESNKFLITEITTGSPGTYKSKMFEEYQGVKLNELHLQLQVGDSPVIKPKKDCKYIAYSIHPKPDGLVARIEKPDFSCDAQISWHISPGERYVGSKNVDDMAIAILLSHHDYSILEDDLEIANTASFCQTQKIQDFPIQIPVLR